MTTITSTYAHSPQADAQGAGGGNPLASAWHAAVGAVGHAADAVARTVQAHDAGLRRAATGQGADPVGSALMHGAISTLEHPRDAARGFVQHIKADVHAVVQDLRGVPHDLGADRLAAAAAAVPAALRAAGRAARSPHPLATLRHEAAATAPARQWREGRQALARVIAAPDHLAAYKAELARTPLGQQVRQAVHEGMAQTRQGAQAWARIAAAPDHLAAYKAELARQPSTAPLVAQARALTHDPRARPPPPATCSPWAPRPSSPTR